MSKLNRTPIEQQDTYILLSPLYPEIFGYTNDEVNRMVTELQQAGVNVLMVDTEKEILFYARSSKLSTLEDLCTFYNIGGLVVRSTALFDQVVNVELVSQ